MKTNTTKPVDESSAEYKTMVDLLAVYTEAENRLAELQTEANRDFMECIDEHRPEYAQLQTILANTESALELLALKHPEWFGDRQSVKTPYGSVKFRRSSVIEATNAELSLVLIEQEAEKDEAFKLADYTRTKREINFEAFEKSDDATLAKFRLKRVEKSNFSVEAAKVNMGKAIKDAEKKAA
jgi:Bacteriophage Mu Gam like protein